MAHNGGNAIEGQVMKRISIMGATIISLFLLLALTLLPSVDAQDQAKRGLIAKPKVGATPEEAERTSVQLWALVIGISDYKYGDQEVEGLTIPSLAYATADARSVYDFLQSAAGGGFRDVAKGGHMTLLVDEKATKANVEKGLNSLKEAKPDDYFIIYVAGHGHIVTQSVQDPATGKETNVSVPYFVLHDTNPKDWKGTGLDMGWFRQTIEREIRAKRGLVLLDTCHSGGIVGQGMRGPELSNGEFQKALRNIVRGVGFISSAGALEYAFEKPNIDHGVFTYYLLQALRGQSDGMGENAADKDKDGIVNFAEVTRYLSKNVPESTEGKQTPFFFTTFVDAYRIPLSIVHYHREPIPGAAYATLVIRNPAVDGVEIAIDDEPSQSAPVGIEVSTQVPAGPHKISYTLKGTSANELPVTLLPGQEKEVEIKLCFSEKDEVDKRPDLPVSVYLQDKEPSPQAKDLFHKGVDNFNRQKFKEAYDLFDRAIQANNGTYSRALVYRGRTEQSLGRDRQAVESFTRALNLKPSDFETQTLLAEAKFVAGGDVTEVYDTLRQITTDYPTYDFAHVVLGDVLLWRKETVRAEQELRRAVALNPKSPPAHMILADALTYQPIKEKQKEAVVEAETAVKLFEELATKQVTFKGWSISHLIFGGGRYINAAAMAEARYILAKALTRAVEYNPMLADRAAYLDRARVSIQEAMRLAQSLRDNVRLAQVLLVSAQNYFLKADLVSAIKDGEQAQKLSDPLHHPELKALVHQLLYRAYASNQRCAQAVEQLQAYIDLSRGRMTQADSDRHDKELERLRNCADANRQKRR